jgi:hypothetical protein
MKIDVEKQWEEWQEKNHPSSFEHIDEENRIDLTANQTLADMKSIADAYKKIKKFHSLMKKWKKGLDAGTVTQEKFDAVVIQAKELISTELVYASGFGLGIGQGDCDAYKLRGDAFAQNIVDDATN